MGHDAPSLCVFQDIEHFIQALTIATRRSRLFGAGDFAHSLLILYAITVLTLALGAANAAKAGVGLYALHNIVYAGISYPAGSLADRVNKRTLLSSGYGLGTLTALLLVFRVSTLPLIAIAFMLGGAYVGIEETLEDSLAAELLPDRFRGIGFGTLAVVNGGGDLVSSLCVGWLWAAFGPTVGFGFAAVLMGGGALYMWVMRRARRAP